MFILQIASLIILNLFERFDVAMLYGVETNVWVTEVINKIVQGQNESHIDFSMSAFIIIIMY